ncbi:hypothetical protein Droror1_Dr00026222 [Drosera rotundifolia]
MSGAGNQIGYFCDQIKFRRFDDATLQILHSILLHREVQSLLEIRSNLTEFLRSESLIAIREATAEPLEHKLFLIDFLVRAFAVVNDVESCLALRYEALAMRQSHSVSHQCLRVTHEEWMTFAEHAFSNGFYSISAKAFENALSCLQMNGISTRNDLIMSTDCVGAAENINKLKDEAIKLSANHPVQVQTADYLKCKTVGSLKQTSLCKQGLGYASSSFRNGLKRRNEACLQRYRELQKVDRTPYQIP